MGVVWSYYQSHKLSFECDNTTLLTTQMVSRLASASLLSHSVHHEQCWDTEVIATKCWQNINH